jgi:NADPH2:quinone reductase
MRAIQIRQPGGPEVLELVDLPMPVPRDGEVRVQARAIGVGRPDVLIRKGTYKWMPPLPAIPGSELAGVVERLGQGADPALLGRQVLVSARELTQRGGCYSEYICVPADAIYVLPESISAEDAVGLPNYQLALALFRSASQSATTSILVPGAAGGVASALTQIALARGIQVIGTASTDAKRQYALANGVAHLVSNEPATMQQAVMALTNGRGVDIAFDHLGAASLIACIRCLAPMGMAVSYNIVQGPPSNDVFMELRALLGRSLAVRAFSMHTFDEHRDVRRGLMQEAIELMASGRIRPTPARCFQFSEVAAAHTLLDQGQSFGKLVITP